MRECPRLWLTLGALCILSARARDVAAQSPHASSDTLTTRSGVFSFQQSNRGKDIYAGNCRSCHTPESHTGAVFNAIWEGRSLADLYLFIRERMPKNDPGALSPQEYADVVAYLLRMNKMPMGDVELPADSSALARVRITISSDSCSTR